VRLGICISIQLPGESPGGPAAATVVVVEVEVDEAVVEEASVLRVVVGLGVVEVVDTIRVVSVTVFSSSRSRMRGKTMAAATTMTATAAMPIHRVVLRGPAGSPG